MNDNEIRLARTGHRRKVYYGEEVFDPGTDPPDLWTTKKRDSFKWTNVRVVYLHEAEDQLNGGYTLGIGNLGLAGLKDHTDHYSVVENLANADEVGRALETELHPKARWLADKVRNDLVRWEEARKTKTT